MTRQTTASSQDPLEVLASTLLARARSDAESARAAADADAELALARARAEADAMLADARARGAADGAAVVATERARAEREARGVLLHAQREAHDELRRAARAAVSALRDDPFYPALLKTLRDRVAQELGPEVAITEMAAGGVLAEAGCRRIAYSLDDLADDVMDRLGSELDELWSP